MTATKEQLGFEEIRVDEDVAKVYEEKDVHGAAHAKRDAMAPYCDGCHGGHDILAGVHQDDLAAKTCDFWEATVPNAAPNNLWYRFVVTDGADTASDAKLRDVRSTMLQTDVFAFAIAIDPPERAPINTRVNVMALRDITDNGGGRTEVVHG